MSHYDQILGLDPLHFAANYRKARLAWSNRDPRNGNLSDIIELGRTAERSHPDSGLAKGFTVLAEWERERLKSEGGEPPLNSAQSSEWIEKLRAAVQCARSECDLYGELDCLNTLSWLLASQFEDTHGMETFREASMICSMVENQIKYFEDTLQAAFYDTYARVLSFDVTSRESYDKARLLAKRSLDLKPSEYVFETLKRLHRLGTENGWPTVLS